MRPALLLCLAAIGCTSADEHVSDIIIDPTGRDLPVAIIDEWTNPAWTAGKGLSTSPDALDWVVGIGELTDGRIALPEEHRFRLFDSTGTEAWRYGKQGMGPTEFLGLSQPCGFRGDTVAAVDVRHNRFVFIVAEVGVVATEPVGGFTMGEAACSGRGALLLTRETTDSARFTATTEVWIRGGPGSDSTRIATRQTHSRHVIGAEPITVGFVDTLLFIADPNAGSIELLAPDGTSIRRMVLGGVRQRVTELLIRTGVDSFPYDSRLTKERMLQRVLARPRAEYLSAFNRVTPAGPDRLWIWGLRPRGSDTTRILAVSTAGEMVGEVLIPGGERATYSSILGMVPRGLAFGHRDTEGNSRVTIVAWPAFAP